MSTEQTASANNLRIIPYLSGDSITMNSLVDLTPVDPGPTTDDTIASTVQTDLTSIQQYQ